MKTVLARVNGRVQGVWFRSSTQSQAKALGVTGYVRNLTDGSVEIMAQGADPAVDALIDWAHEGPERARVLGVDVDEYWGNDLYLDFQIAD